MKEINLTKKQAQKLTRIFFYSMIFYNGFPLGELPELSDRSGVLINEETEKILRLISKEQISIPAVADIISHVIENY